MRRRREEEEEDRLVEEEKGIAGFLLPKQIRKGGARWGDCWWGGICEDLVATREREETRGLTTSGDLTRGWPFGRSGWNACMELSQQDTIPDTVTYPSLPLTLQ